MLTTSVNKPVLLRFSHVKYRSHQTFLRINATWKVRVLDCDQIWKHGLSQKWPDLIKLLVDGPIWKCIQLLSLIRLYLWFSGDNQTVSLNIDPHKIVKPLLFTAAETPNSFYSPFN
ncbi:uncharacterized protein [Malus domestica]|uniref:uncharacterized protein isoform X2 n=1 Tax=Malus domestica TaxID=3750 RepID=UPI0039767DD7